MVVLALAFGASPALARAPLVSPPVGPRIQVPVTVEVDGKPVRGLTAQDFLLSAGRKKLDVVGFETFDLGSGNAEAKASATIDIALRRHFLLVFDLSKNAERSIARARSAALRLVEKGLHPTDLVAVATHSELSGPKLVLGFTPDRLQAVRAIADLGLEKNGPDESDPLRLALAFEDRSLEEILQSTQRDDSDEADEDLTSELSDVDLLDERTRRQRAEHVLSVARSMVALGRLMSNIAARKQVILFLEGFDAALWTVAPGGSRQGTPHAVRHDQAWNLGGDTSPGRPRSQEGLVRALDELRQGDCVVHAVDVGAKRGASTLKRPWEEGKDGLAALARPTGGEVFRDFADLALAMETTLARTAVTYLLSFEAEAGEGDTFRRLKVELSDTALRSWKGASVTARSGYFASRLFGKTDRVARLLDAAELVVAGRERADFRLVPLVAPFRGGAGRSFVPLVLEIEGAGLAAETIGSTLPVEIFAYVLTEDGRIVDLFGQTFGLDLGKSRAALERGGLKFFGHLELPLGEYSVRVLVRNGETGANALSVFPLQVPAAAGVDSAGGEAFTPFVLGPFFPEPLDKWLVVRENPRGSLRDEPYPFLLGERPYIPAARPKLAMGEDVELAIVGYNLPEGDVQIQAKVLGLNGREITNAGELTFRARESGGEEGREVITASFVPRRMEAGIYRLRVEVAAGGGPPLVSTEAPFEVPLGVPLGVP